MDNYILNLQDKFSEDLGRAGNDYIDISFEIFHKYRLSESDCGQAAVGNILTALELIVKRFIASKNLGCIFKDIPPDLRTLISNPDSIPTFFEWRNYDIDIHSNKYQMLDFRESLECYYIFYPQLKQFLLPHTNFLFRWKDASLGGILPSFNMYEFERIGFAVFTILISLINDDTFPYVWYTLTEDDNAFLADFESKRIERVKLALKQSQQSASELSSDQVGVLIAHDWETFVIECPACKLNGLSEGFCEIAIGKDEDGPNPTLDFFASSFFCEECGLKLYDVEEMRLADMNTIYNRSHELEKWLKERDYVSDWYLDKNG